MTSTVRTRVYWTTLTTGDEHGRSYAECSRCGGRARVTFPVSVADLARFVDQFNATHAGCVEPTNPISRIALP